MAAEDKNSAELTITFANGDVKTYKIAGEIFGDIETGAFKIENENGSKFLFLPNPEFHTGKRKRRLQFLQNLKHG